MAHWSGIGIPKTNAIALEVSYTHTHCRFVTVVIAVVAGTAVVVVVVVVVVVGGDGNNDVPCNLARTSRSKTSKIDVVVVGDDCCIVGVGDDNSDDGNPSTQRLGYDL